MLSNTTSEWIEKQTPVAEWKSSKQYDEPYTKRWAYLLWRHRLSFFYKMPRKVHRRNVELFKYCQQVNNFQQNNFGCSVACGITETAPGERMYVHVNSMNLSSAKSTTTHHMINDIINKMSLVNPNFFAPKMFRFNWQWTSVTRLSWGQLPCPATKITTWGKKLPHAIYPILPPSNAEYNP